LAQVRADIVAKGYILGGDGGFARNKELEKVMISVCYFFLFLNIFLAATGGLRATRSWRR